MSDGPSMQELRDEAREFDLTFASGTTKQQAQDQIAAARAARESAPSTQEQPPTETDQHRPNDPLGTAPDEQPGEQPADDGETREIRKKIEHVTDRGDWTDPFSGLITHYGNDRNPQSGAIRRGRTAALVVPKGD